MFIIHIPHAGFLTCCRVYLILRKTTCIGWTEQHTKVLWKLTMHVEVCLTVCLIVTIRNMTCIMGNTASFWSFGRQLFVVIIMKICTCIVVTMHPLPMISKSCVDYISWMDCDKFFSMKFCFCRYENLSYYKTCF